MKDRKDYTTFMLAAAKEQLDILDILLTKGIDINHQTSDGLTTLMIMAILGKFESIKYLIEHGADFKLRDHKEGHTTLSFAKEEPNQKIADYLHSLVASHLPSLSPSRRVA